MTTQKHRHLPVRRRARSTRLSLSPGRRDRTVPRTAPVDDRPASELPSCPWRGPYPDGGFMAAATRAERSLRDVAERRYRIFSSLCHGPRRGVVSTTRRQRTRCVVERRFAARSGVAEVAVPASQTVFPLVGRAGFEPATHGLKAHCSDQAELTPLNRFYRRARPLPHAERSDPAPPADRCPPCTGW
jgi:hypothetical protein